jgi:hypothetical protein
MDEYYIKYLKYKNKYLELKQYGGVRFNMFSKLSPGVVRQDNLKKKSNKLAENLNEKSMQDALIKAQQEEKEANAIVNDKSVKAIAAYEAWKKTESKEKDALDKEKEKVKQRFMEPIIKNANTNFTNTYDNKREIENQYAALQKTIAKEWAILEKTMMVETNKAYQVLNNAQLEEKEARLIMKKKEAKTKKRKRELRNATKMINMINKIAAKCNKAVKISKKYVNNSKLMHEKLTNAQLEEKKAILNLDAKKILTNKARKELKMTKPDDKNKANAVLNKAELEEKKALDEVRKTKKKTKRHLRHALNATKMAEMAIMIAEKCVAAEKKARNDIK